MLHGPNLVFDIGYFRYPSAPNSILIVCVVSVSLIFIFMILVLVMYRRAKIARREVEERRIELIRMQIEKTEEFLAGR